MRKKLFFLLLCGVLLSACAPVATPASQPTSAAQQTATQKPDSTLVIITAAPAAGQPLLPPAEPTSRPPETFTPPAGSSFTPENIYAPLLSDKDLRRETVYLQQAEVLTLESFPPQYILLLNGSLPTPCSLLRVSIATIDSDNKIIIDVYSLTHPKMACVQRLKEFEAKVPLGNFASGTYSIWVNGQNVGEIEP